MRRSAPAREFATNEKEGQLGPKKDTGTFRPLTEDGAWLMKLLHAVRST
jgi:hypothetical protein